MWLILSLEDWIPGLGLSLEGLGPQKNLQVRQGEYLGQCLGPFIEKGSVGQKDKLNPILGSIWKCSDLFSGTQDYYSAAFCRSHQTCWFCSFFFQCNTAYQCLLIADQHCRTRKYFLCLASGIPCVSHVWVHDSCHANQLQNYRNYLLPAGYSLEEQRILDWWVFESPSRMVGRKTASFWRGVESRWECICRNYNCHRIN